MKMNVRDFLKLMSMLVAVPFVLTACDKDDDPEVTPTPAPPVEPDYSVDSDKQGIYVFNSGNEGMSIEGSLSFINFSQKAVTNGLFKAKNGRSLGMTVQNGAIWNNKLYVAVYGSNTIEVMDKVTTESIKQIKLGTEDGLPRFVLADDSYVYVSTQTGFVTRINPETDAVDKTIAVGPNPEEMVILNNFLYVVNSDGLNWESGYANGKSVSKIDLTSFTEVKKIEIGINPTRIVTDGTNVYALSMGDYGATPSSIWKIDANDNATDTGIGATWLAVSNGVLYTINSVYNEDWTTTNYYKSYNLSDMSVKSEAFLVEEVDAPAAITIDAEGGSIYVSSYNLAYGYASYDTDGYVNQYDLDGKLVKKYDVGVGPCYMLVLR
jgi:YVTN family beta-propeller protein